MPIQKEARSHEAQIPMAAFSERREIYASTKNTIQRIQYYGYGGPEVEQLEDFDLPAPGKGQILVKVVAASINEIDWKIRQG